MKTVSCLILMCIILSSSLIATTPAFGETAVGVKKGDWVEYTISMRGPPLNPMRNLTWYRTEILWVEGTWFQVKKTSLSVNGTFSSSTWEFNLAEGQTYGWVFIPANLSKGDVFFDSERSANITIEGEEQKTLLGATRAVTHTSDPGKVYKEWDKATGVYVYSLEETDNYTITFNATATNLWSPQTLEQNPAVSYQIVAAIIIVLTVLMLPLVMFIGRRKTKASPYNLKKIF